MTLGITGMPAGMTAKFTPATIASPGSGASVLAVSAGATLTGGSYTLVVTAAGGGMQRSQSLTVKVPTFTLSLKSPTVSLIRGTSTPLSFSVAVLGFSAPVSLTLSGLPSGVAASFVPSAFNLPGAGTGMVTLTALPAARAGARTCVLTASGGGVIHSMSFSLNLLSPPSIIFGANTPTLTLVVGTSQSAELTTVGGASFHSAITWKVTGLPAGMTAVFSPSTIASPGLGSSILTVADSSAVTPRTYSITIAAVGSSVTRTMQLTVVVR